MFEELKKNLLGIWERVDRQRRTGLIVGAAAVLALAIALLFWALHTSYEVLFSDLEERDAATIVAELKQLKVPYRVDDSGHKILVPEQQVHETRIKLMGKGVLLNGGVGFEIFDNKDLGMTEYTQKINYQRALQGELARTIMAVEPVKLARVHLVLPEASLFKRDKTKPKASVSLVLRPEGRLGSEQILGIQRLVAASTPGLEASAVTVLDQRGVTLSAQADEDDAAPGTSSKLRMKREVEDYLTRKIAAVMDRTYGPGQAIVSVDVTLNFDEIHRTVQEVLPATTAGGEAAGVVVRKRQSLYRQGHDGVTKTVDGAAAAPQNGNLNSTSEVEYEVSRRVEQVVAAPGGIRRVSIGVLLPKSLGEEQTGRVRQIVAMVAGINEERGDAIAVHGIDQLLQQTAQPDTQPVARAAEPVDAGVVPAWLRRLMPGTSPWVLALAIAALAVVVGMAAGAAAMARVTRRRRRNDTAPGADRRHELLTEIQQWIEAEKATTEGAVGR